MSDLLKRAAERIIEKQGRWPAGAPGGKGGQFAPGQKGGTLWWHSKKPGSMFAPGSTFPNGESQAWKAEQAKKPAPPPPGAKPHPKVNDKGQPVTINYPTKPSNASTWTDPKATATFVPGGETPAALNGVRFRHWTSVPRSDHEWAAVPGQNPKIDQDMPFTPVPGKSVGAGVIIREPDGRVWLTTPTNSFGGYKNTFPKGTVEHGLSMQASAIREAWEETGLQVRITGILGDYERTTSKARFYIAERVGGTPAAMGWESQSIRLAPAKDMAKLLNMPVDKGILDDLEAEGFWKTAKIGHWQNQPRWPSGSPLGGQFKAYDGQGILMPPKVGSAANPQPGKKCAALYAMAQANDVKGLVDAAVAQNKLAKANEAAGKKNTQAKWTAQVAQYATQLVADHAAMTQAAASADKINGPMKVSALKPAGSKPGGSNPGGLYTDDAGQKWLVKGNAQFAQGNVTGAQSDDRARNEVLAAKLMHAVGVGAPEMALIDLEGKHGGKKDGAGSIGVASKWVGGTEAFNIKNLSHLAAARADFAVHAWLGNYDVIGASHDNTMIVGGKAVNIDTGGALLFRAQGLPKTLDKTASEFESMRGPVPGKPSNQTAWSVYGAMTESELKASAAKLASIDNATVKKLVETYGPGDAKAKAALTETLIARRDAILSKAGVVVSKDGPIQEAKPSPAPMPPKVAETVTPASSGMPAHIAMPVWKETAAGVVPKYEALAAAALAMHNKGDLEGLKALAQPNAKGKAPWAKLSPNGIEMTALHSALVADLGGKTAQAAQAVATGNATVTGADGTNWTGDGKGVLHPVEATTRPIPAKKPKTPAAQKSAAPNFDTAKLPISNSNSGSHNNKIEQIKALFEAGDEKGILALKIGTNTYAPKVVQIANDALAALGSPHQVVKSQAENSHPALTGGTTQAPPPPKEPKPKTATAGDTSWLKLGAGEKVVEVKEQFGVKSALIEVPAKGYDPTAFGQPPNFFENGTQGPTGKWKSSKAEVNEANNAAVNLIYDTATKDGTADKLKALKFDIVTGGNATKVSIENHKAEGVKEYFSDTLAELEAQTKPTYKTQHSGSMVSSYASAARTISAAFAAKGYAEFKTHAQRAADYLVLSKDAAASLPVPAAGQFHETGPARKDFQAFRAATTKAYSSLTEEERSAAKAYTGSSYGQWNYQLRTGDYASLSDGGKAMVSAFAKAAQDIPDGTILWRGLDVGLDTYKSVVGGLIQDGSFNSSSYGASPKFSHKQTWLRIHCAKGVKGMDATVFSVFNSGEREVIIQNNVRYLVLKAEHHPNWKDSSGKSWGSKNIIDVIALPHD